MLVDAPGIRSRLHGIVYRLAPPPLREDLLQEAMIHLWRMEEQEPGKDEVWYLQGCRFHLQNFLRQGRSVDSWKRFRDRVLNRTQAVEGVNPVEPAGPNGSVWDEVSVQDFMAALSQWLTPRERATLLCLMDGLSAREAAKRLNVSHTVVNRHRAQIANLALKLGIAPTRNRPGAAPK